MTSHFELTHLLAREMVRESTELHGETDLEKLPTDLQALFLRLACRAINLVDTQQSKGASNVTDQ